jgi:Tfp pilus tip-associated adhesin PilY1
MNGRILLALIATLVLLPGGAHGQTVNIGDYTATPPFVSRSITPNVMLLVSNDHTNFYVGYRDLSGYNNAVSYYGYFDPDKCYKYGDPNGLGYSYFYTQDGWNAFNHYTLDGSGNEPDGGAGGKDMWSGNFLNWLTMCHGDFVRKTLTGGRYTATDSSTYWILERGDIPNDGHVWTKTYAPSGTPNPDIAGLIPYVPYVASTYTPEYPTPSNQVLHFDFEPSHWSGTTITDTAGVNNSGTATNGANSTSTNVFYGSSSLNLDGTNDYVEIADDPEISSFSGGQLTIEFWMRRDTNDNNELIIGNGGSTGNAGYAVVSKNGGGIRFQLWNSSLMGILDSVTIPSNGAWHYIVCTYNKAVDLDGDGSADAGVMRIFIDGCLNAESTTNFYGDVGDSTYPLRLGRSAQAPYNGSSQCFDGRLDEVSIWKEAFTANMVRSRYENTWGTRTVNCLAAFGGGTFTFNNVGTTMRVQGGTVDQTLTVKVRVTQEPRGLLQDFSGSIRFGLMSYSYDEEDEGGVLRANVSTPGETGSQYNDMISFINNFTQKGWDPVAEMYWEATRYFRNSSSSPYSPNPNFKTASADGFPIREWVDPMQSECQKNFIIIVNDEYPSRDQDMMPGGYGGLGAESAPGLAAATVGGDAAPAGGLNTQWWTNEVGKWEGINGNSWAVGCYGANTSGTCSPLKTVTYLGQAYGICPNEPLASDDGTFNIAGAAYWAHETHLRPDLVTNAEVTSHPEKKISIETYAIAFRASPSGYQVPPPPMNQLWLAAKYGGFQDRNGNGIPDLQSEWDEDGDGVPDNFSYAEEGEQFSAALRKALLSILSRASSGTAASILSASRSGQGALYQAMFYPSRVDKLGNAAEWTGQLNSFWVDQFGSLREETPSDPSTPPATITQPFTGTVVSTSGIDLRQLNLFHDKVVRLYFDTSLGRTRAKVYPVSTLGRIVTGTATSTAADTLWDTEASFSAAGVRPNMVVEQFIKDANGNIVEEHSATIPSGGAVNATSVPTPGINWTIGDEYVISQQGPETTVRELDDINPLWDGGRWLAEHGAKDRHIFTWVDLNHDGAVDGNRAFLDSLTSTDEIKELAGTGSQTVTIGTGSKATSITEDRYVLEADPLASTLKPYLRATSNLQSAQIINWIRGVDPPGATLRKRTYLTPNDTTTGWLRTLKLGDIVYSTPTIVGTPMENYDLIYQDHSYTGFYRAYGDRRNVVYVGANDGMLHAFNAGFYDRDYGIFYDHTGHALGEELWAFIPYQLLPQLEFLTELGYVHVYYVDQKPKIFDARIFTADSTHVNGWGTLLVQGMRMGGKLMPVDLNGDGNTTDPGENSFVSAYFLLDITDPLHPRFLGSFTNTTVVGSTLGLTTSYPAIFRIKDDWYMAVGSGPNGVDALQGKSGRVGGVFLAPLTASGFGTSTRIALPNLEATAFVGDISSVDLDLTTGTSIDYSGGINWSAEALYFGSIYQNPSFNSSLPSTDTNRQWKGRMYRLPLPTDPSGIGSLNATSMKVLAPLATDPDDMGPITGAANLAWEPINHRYWVYFGTGRFFAGADIDDTCTQKFYGLKEPIVGGTGSDRYNLTYATVSTLADKDITTSTNPVYNATDALVYDGGSVDYNGDGHIDYDHDFTAFVNQVESQKNNGWLIQGSPGERMLGMPTVLGGLTLFTSYLPPSGTACQYEGTGYLYAPFFRTGTAYKASVIGLGTDNLVERKAGLGVGVQAEPTPQRGDETGAFVQSSTGTILRVKTETPFPVKSGVRSWRMD